MDEAESISFLARLRDNCEQFADKTAIEFLTEEPQVVSYADLEVMVQRTMAYLLALSVEPGDRIALQLPKSLVFIYLHLAIMRVGAISLPLNPAYPRDELRYFLKDAGARLLFADVRAQAEIADLADELPSLAMPVFIDTNDAADFERLLNQAATTPGLPSVPADPDQTALMIYTSGTTGRPKGAMITHGNLTANLNALHKAWGWQPKDVLLHVLPIFHIHGLVVALHGALNAGATTLMLPKFDAEQALALMEERQVTVFMGVPTIHRRLLAVPDAARRDLGHMRLLTSGSDRLPDDAFYAFQETFGHTLLERYGMTETGMNLSNPLHGERRPGSVGLPLPGVEARIVDPVTEEVLPDGEVGEVQIRGPHVCKGYWQQPEKTAEAFTEDGWLRTGDLGLREPDGYFTLKGRSKDLIITGGLNVYPPEVELVLAEHPAVASGVVIGCPDTEWGEQVTAVIQLVAGQQVSAEEIMSFCRGRLANYKAPRRVVFVEEMPQTALGKVQKAQLRQLLCKPQ